MKQVVNGFGHQGEDLTPRLSRETVPYGRTSFVVITYEPDAPTGSAFSHWLVIELPASNRELIARAGSVTASIPEGCRQAPVNPETQEYPGAASQRASAHRCIDTVRAVSVDKLQVSSEASGALVGFVPAMHSLCKATLSVMFGSD